MTQAERAKIFAATEEPALWRRLLRTVIPTAIFLAVLGAICLFAEGSTGTVKDTLGSWLAGEDRWLEDVRRLEDLERSLQIVDGVHLEVIRFKELLRELSAERIADERVWHVETFRAYGVLIAKEQHKLHIGSNFGGTIQFLLCRLGFYTRTGVVEERLIGVNAALRIYMTSLLDMRERAKQLVPAKPGATEPVIAKQTIP